MPGLFANPVLQAGFAVTILFTPICIAVTGMRFWAARLTKRSVGMEDWFALGALVFYLLWVIFLALMSTYERTSLDQAQSGAPSKMLFIATLMFPLNQLFAKLSILFLYYRIFGILNSYAFWIKVVGVLQIIHTVVNIIVNIFLCVPVNKFWEPATPGHCINYSVFLAVMESTNCLIDFILAIQAVIMLRSLQTSRKTRWRLSIVFIMGGLAGVFGFAKIGASLSSRIAVGNELIEGVWATVQMGLSIICCCVITFKPLLARLGLVAANMTSKATSLLGLRRSSRNASQSQVADNTNDITWIRLSDNKNTGNGVVINAYTSDNDMLQADKLDQPGQGPLPKDHV